MPFRRRLLTGLFCAAVLAVLPDGADGQDTLTDCGRPCIARLRARADRFRQIREQHERGDFFNAPVSQMQELESEGFQQLPNLTDIAKASKALLDVGLGRVAHAVEIPRRSGEKLREYYERVEQTGTALKIPANVLEKGADMVEALQSLSERKPPSSTPELDAWISRLENGRKFAEGSMAGFDPMGKLSTYTTVAAASVSPPLIGLYIARAKASKSTAEKNAYYEKAGKEVERLAQAEVELAKSFLAKSRAIRTGVPGYTGISAEIALIDANFEVWSRLAYWGIAHHAANRERARAQADRNDALSIIDYHIKLADDRAQFAEELMQERERQRRALLPKREPGGIKLGGEAADELARRLDVTGMAFDPPTGRLILTGRSSSTTLDLGILPDILRLAMEKQDPFFSLNPVTIEQWDRSATYLSDRIVDRYFKTASGRAEFTARLPRAGSRVPFQSDRDCYYALVRDFDPELHRDLEAQFDIREERVYSPTWLAYSPVGRILYEADLAIKAVAAGLLETGGQESFSLAAVWRIPGFKPIWMMRRGKFAGRANFEIDDTSRASVDGNYLSLADIKPKLKMVQREPGKERDLEPDDADRAVMQHFDEHWREYVERVPVLAELMSVLRTYVAARYLRERHPALAQRILAASSPPIAPSVPLYNFRSDTVFACMAGGELVPLRDGSQQTFSIGGGFGGGVTVSRASVGFAGPSGSSDAAWVDRVIDSGARGEVENGDDRALVVDLDTLTTVPLDTQRSWWGLAVLFAGIIALAAAAARRIRSGPRRRLACAHCAALHRITEAAGSAADIAAVGSLVFIAALPVIAATIEAGDADGRFVLGLLGAASVAVVASLAGAAVHGAVLRVSGWGGEWRGPLRHAGTGARWIGSGAAVLLLSGGASDAAVHARLVSLLGSDAAEPLLALIESTVMVRAALFTLVAVAAAAFLARWVVPFAFDSRPLPMGVTHPTPNEVI